MLLSPAARDQEGTVGRKERERQGGDSTWSIDLRRESQSATFPRRPPSSPRQVSFPKAELSLLPDRFQ